MLFIALAVLYLVLKALDVAWLAPYSVWWVIAPLFAAAAWWAFADKSGYTQRKQMEKLEDRKEQRRQRQLEAMGRGPTKKR